MVNDNNENYAVNTSITWEEFIKTIKNDLDLLNNRKIEIKEIKDKSKLFSDAISNIDSVLENSSLLLNEDNSLARAIGILKFFKERNNLSNKMPKEAFVEIVNSEKINSIINIPITLDTELDSIDAKMSSIKEVLDGNLTPNLIIEVARSHNYSEEKIKELLFYPMHKKVLIVDRIMNNEQLNTEEVQTPLDTETESEVEENEISEETPVVEPVVPITVKDDASLDETIINREEPALSLFTALEEPNNEKNNSKLKYEELKDKYERLLAENTDFLNMYYELTQTKSAILSSYTKYSNEELREMGIPDTDIVLITALKLFEKKSDVSDSVVELNNQILNNDDEEMLDTTYEYTAEIIEDFIKLFDLLKTLDEEQNKIKSEESEEENKVYFAHDENGNPLMPLSNEYAKKIENFGNKVNSNNSDTISLNTRKLLGADNAIKALDKNIYLSKSSPSTAYVRINVGGKAAVFVLTMANLENIADVTSEVVFDNLNQIKTQMALIEANDEKELEVQESIRKTFDSLTLEDEMGRR